MMKKTTIILMAMLMNLSLFAQLKPEAGSKGMGFRLTGLANIGLFPHESTAFQGYRIHDPQRIFRDAPTINNLMPQELIFGKYYLSEQNVVRIGFGAGYYSDYFFQEDTVFLVDATSEEISVSTFSLGFNIGYERHLASAAVKIDPYIGAQLNTGYMHRINYESITADEGPVPSNTVETIIYPSGWTIGLHFLTGFNYFITSNFSLGAEMSLGYDMIRFGGHWERTTVDTEQDATLLDERGTYRNVHHRIGVNSTAGINATVFF